MDDPPGLATALIPYRAQETGWTCGAASLRMVYASLGLELTEGAIWSSLKPNPYDRSGVKASRLAWDAQRRGFEALALRARDPWELIRVSFGQRLRLIFQQPLTWGSPRRHFSVLAEADDDGIVLHDPQLGVAIRRTRAEWLELWGAKYGNHWAAANESVAVSKLSTDSPTTCRTCLTPIPESVLCPVCGESIPLRPTEALGCVAAACPERLWIQILCCSCDHAIDEHCDIVTGSAPLLLQENPNMLNGSRFSDLTKAMQDYQRTLAQAQGASPDPGLREMLASLQKVMKDSAEQLVESLDRLEEKHEAHARQLDAKRAETAKQIEVAKKAREEALAKLAAKKAARAARPQPRQEAEDPHLGAKLRDKLLEEFGTRVDQHPSGPSEAQGSLIDFDPGT